MRISQNSPALVIEEGAETRQILGAALALFGIAGIAIGWFNAQTAFLLISPLLLLYGLKMLLFGKTTTHRFDRSGRSIIIESANRFGTAQRTLRFDDIADVSVEEIRKAGSAPSYYVHYVTTSGERIRWADSFDGSKEKTLECAEAARQVLGLKPAAG
jgi:hypothetical protein